MPVSRRWLPAPPTTATTSRASAGRSLASGPRVRDLSLGSPPFCPNPRICSPLQQHPAIKMPDAFGQMMESPSSEEVLSAIVTMIISAHSLTSRAVLRRADWQLDATFSFSARDPKVDAAGTSTRQPENAARVGKLTSTTSTSCEQVSMLCQDDTAMVFVSVLNDISPFLC